MNSNDSNNNLQVSMFHDVSFSLQICTVFYSVFWIITRLLIIKSEGGSWEASDKSSLVTLQKWVRREFDRS